MVEAAAPDIVPEHLQGPAMPVSKLLVIANTFLVDTTRFLNHFAAKCVPLAGTLLPRALRLRARRRHRRLLSAAAAWSSASVL